MAYSIPSRLLVSALLLLLAATNPMADAQFTTGIDATVGGRICCVVGGICSTGAPGAVGAMVTLTSASDILSQPITTTTGADGSFTITDSNLFEDDFRRIVIRIFTPRAVRARLNPTVCPQLTQVGKTRPFSSPFSPWM